MYPRSIIHLLLAQVCIPGFYFHVISGNYPNFLVPFQDRIRAMNFVLDTWSQYDNPEEGYAREGDIKERPESRKTSTTDKNLLWPDGLIKYYIHDSIGNHPEKLRIIEDAMDDIMKLTCIRFLRIFPDPYGVFPLQSWVNITGNEVGCFSDLGRLKVSPNIINLDVDRCFQTPGHALHEMLHTLGVYHEHMRPDRDDHIEIIWDNIKSGDSFNFVRLNTDKVTNYGLPYDYDSIMHYSMTAFSVDKSLPTIVPRAKDVEIGQRDHLSLLDIEKLLISYECEEFFPSYEDLNAEDFKNDRNDLTVEILNITKKALDSPMDPDYYD